MKSTTVAPGKEAFNISLEASTVAWIKENARHQKAYGALVEEAICHYKWKQERNNPRGSNRGSNKCID